MAATIDQFFEASSKLSKAKNEHCYTQKNAPQNLHVLIPKIYKRYNSLQLLLDRP